MMLDMFRLKWMILALFFYNSFTVGVAGNDDAAPKAKAARIHAAVITIDSHTDTPLRMVQKGFNIGVKHDARTEYSRVDLPRMKEGGLDGVFFAVFVSQGPRNTDGYEKVKQRAILLFDTIHAAVNRYPNLAGIAVTPEEMNRLARVGKRSVFIGVENGYAIGKDLSLISTFYLRGARYITLCHTKNNDICDSSTDTVENNGLTPFGHEVVREMNELGMMVDVSHISDKAVYDVLACTKAPVIASHSCAKALCNNPRNLSDDLLKKIAQNGGVVQMCILSEYVKTPPPNPARDSAKAAVRKMFRDFEGLSDDEMKNARKAWNSINDNYPLVLATVSDVVDHIDHMVKVAGINHVGIGTDFDGGGGVTGCFDVSEMGNITLELVRRGYSENEIRKIWGRNLIRVMRSVEKVSQKYKESGHCN